MLTTIKENVLKPALTRCGFLLAGVLISQGVAEDYAHMIATGVIGLGLIICDLVLAYLRKKNIVATSFWKGVQAVNTPGTHDVPPRPKGL